MALESKHIALLQSCSRFLRAFAKTPVVVRLNRNGIMVDYADNLDEIANELSLLNLPKTVVTLDQLFGNDK